MNALTHRLLRKATAVIFVSPAFGDINHYWIESAETVDENEVLNTRAKAYMRSLTKFCSVFSRMTLDIRKDGLSVVANLLL